MFQALSQFPLFKDLAKADLEIIAPIFYPRAYPTGATIIEQGGKADRLFLLVRGDVRIRYKPYDGDTITLTHVHAGGVFGWSAVLGNPLYSSSVVCMTACETFEVKGSDLHMLEANHETTERAVLNMIADAVSARWEKSQTQVRSMLAKGVSENISHLGKQT
jgi:CRP-like cAMP-binding protein